MSYPLRIERLELAVKQLAGWVGAIGGRIDPGCIDGVPEDIQSVLDNGKVLEENDSVSPEAAEQ